MRQTRLHLLLLLAASLSSGCLGRAMYQIHNPPPDIKPPPEGTVPVENDKVTLPPYMIEPPDVLFIEVTLPPEKVEQNPYSTALAPQPVSASIPRSARRHDRIGHLWHSASRRHDL